MIIGSLFSHITVYGTTALPDKTATCTLMTEVGGLPTNTHVHHPRTHSRRRKRYKGEIGLLRSPFGDGYVIADVLICIHRLIIYMLPSDTGQDRNWHLFCLLQLVASGSSSQSLATSL